MQTNHAEMKFDLKNIRSAFDIYAVDKGNNYDCNIFNHTEDEFKIHAVQWENGKRALLLFKKGSVELENLRSFFNKNYEKVDIQVTKVNILNRQHCEKYLGSDKKNLALLLFNSMHNFKEENFSYNNITGKYFCYRSNWAEKDPETKEIEYLHFLEVALDTGNYLNLKVRTFGVMRKNIDKNCSQYVVDPETGVFRRKYSSDKNLRTYVKRAKEGEKYNIPSLDISSYTNFLNCKMGALQTFMDMVNKKLSEYLSIQFEEKEDVIIFNKGEKEDEESLRYRYGEKLREKGVVIVDEIGAEDLADQIAALLKALYGVETKRGRLDLDAYNIRIIHSKKYYENCKEKDIYMNATGIVQHVTKEDFVLPKKKKRQSDLAKIMIEKIVTELLIKNDVFTKKVTLYDWENLSKQKPYWFVVRRCERNQDGEKVNNHYYRAKVMLNGGIEFDDKVLDEEGNDINVGQTSILRKVKSDWQRVHEAWEDRCNYEETVEYLVYTDVENIYSGILTKERILPNMKNIQQTLKKLDDCTEIPAEELKKGIEAFLKQCSQKDSAYTSRVKTWKETLKEDAFKGGDIATEDIKKMLNMRTKAAKDFAKFFEEKYGKCFFSSLRSREKDAIYKLSNMFNINYKCIEGEREDAFKFGIGLNYGALKEKYPYTCIVRKLKSQNGVCKEDMQKYLDILQMMCVDFVRINEPTVRPFIIKYLNEYIRASKNPVKDM